MDLISREALKDYLEINISFGGADKKFKFYDHIDSVSSAFEGMTNGEVIQALFPQCYFLSNFPFRHSSLEKIYVDDKKSNLSHIMTSEEWWNAPYKGVSE